MTANESGRRGDATVTDVLDRHGWKLLDSQVEAFGVHVDRLMADPEGVDSLVEIKSWGYEPSGKDTIKKAIADAYYLQGRGETRPYVLVLTHAPTGLHLEMVHQAVRDGAIAQAFIVELRQLDVL
jgi:hypothetical protein